MLLVEDNPLDAHLVQATLTAADSVDIHAVGELQQALVSITDRSFDVVLLDLCLPDARGLEALQTIRAHAPEIPVVVLTSRNDQSVALEAVRHGAQDYLTKEHIERDVLLRAVRYAVERHQLLAEIRQLSLKDELTGLYNRRGFLTLAEHQLKLALRARQQLALFYADLDGLKQINDAYGHHDGDRAIRDAAEILRRTFRATDIQARIGGDEFALLLPGTEERDGKLVMESIENLLEVNTQFYSGRPLSFSMGMATSRSGERLEAAATRADLQMYEAKRAYYRARDAGRAS
jgi:diguanylate cyclase (GGDEF)-like protein